MKWTDYTFLKKLGAGAFGEVFLVSKDQTYYAMKVQVKERVITKTL